MRRHQQKLPAVSVAVDRLVRRYPQTSPEIVMQIGSSNGSDSLQQSLEIAEQKRFVLVHRQAERRVQRLHVDAPAQQPGAGDFGLELLCEIDEFRRPLGAKTQAGRDHGFTVRVSRPRTEGSSWPAAAQVETFSIARAKPT